MTRRDRQSVKRRRREPELRTIALARRYVEAFVADDDGVAAEARRVDSFGELVEVLDALDALELGDPRQLGGDVAGPGGSHDVDGVIVDTSRALIVDAVECLLVRTGETHAVGVLIDGRVNRTTDRARVLAMLSEDGAAAFVAELVALSGRADRSGLVPGFRRRLAERLQQLERAGDNRPKGERP